VIYLTQDAAANYLDNVRLSYFVGLIDWSEAMDHLATLRSMCEPRDPASIYAARVQRLEQHEGNDDWPESEGGRSPQEQGGLRGNTHVPEDGDDSKMYFTPGPGTGMSSWTFHPFDPDFRPSVPHGHRANQKLHAYQGWIFQASRQVGREPRKNIVALWNDAAFRTMATRAIHYYISHHPSYLNWPVTNPRRLPRKR
jgi:hypothetical protein